MTPERLCPEAEFRESLDDGDFWEYVLNGVLPGEEPFDHGPYDDGPDELDLMTAAPCEVCGATGACGWDDEGRPMVHTR